jgi:hypothetical protein
MKSCCSFINVPCSVLLVTICGDSLHGIFPQFPANAYKALGAILCVSLFPFILFTFNILLQFNSNDLLAPVASVLHVYSWDPVIYNASGGGFYRRRFKTKSTGELMGARRDELGNSES